MDLVYQNSAYHFEVVKANECISELSIFSLEKYFKHVKKSSKVATLKKNKAAIVHALKVSFEKNLISKELYEECSKFLLEFKTGKPALGIQSAEILTNEDLSLLLSGTEILKGKEKILVPSLPMRQFFFILSKTGLRISELILLRRADIKEVNGMYHCFIRGKGSIERYIYMDEKTIHSTYSLFSGSYYLCQFIEDNREYTDIEQETIRKQIWYELKKASRLILGRSDIHPHSIRDYFANELLNNRKMDLKAVSLYLGHQSTDTTTKYYQKSKLSAVDVLG